MMLGREVLEYDPSRLLVFTVDLPVSGQVTRASRSDPFLGFRLDLVPARVAELAARVYPRGVRKPTDPRGLFVGRTTDGIISPGGVGYDINCGVRLLVSDRSAKEVGHRLEALVHELSRTIPSGAGRGGRAGIIEP